MRRLTEFEAVYRSISCWLPLGIDEGVSVLEQRENGLHLPLWRPPA